MWTFCFESDQKVNCTQVKIGVVCAVLNLKERQKLQLNWLEFYKCVSVC